jgi:hypothetical protein
MERVLLSVNEHKNLHRVGYLYDLHVPSLSDEVVIFFSSIVVLNTNGQFWVVPLLHSVSDIKLAFTEKWLNKLSYKTRSTPTYSQSYEIKC